ncbi:hypothetical protein [Ciceribacter sp. RN22]|nr:hypothetical protein [Ciceribacter sp. RN22]MCO6180884.1 hypothetical protein [Ciceribacter sp. RN22]
MLEGIKRRLLAPEVIAEFLSEYQAEQKRLNAVLIASCAKARGNSADW